MKVKILRNTFCSGELVEEGKVYDLPDQEAGILIRLRKAEEAPAVVEKAAK